MDDRSIIQLSTPRIVSAIHVIRISGEESLPFLSRHTGLSEVKPRHVYHRDLFSDLEGGKVIDSIICFFFVAPHSYTGEDMVEIHTHGSLLIVDEILNLAQKENIRMALPGEFTYRAFLNGKMGLEQAEAVDSLIQARTDFQKHHALQVLQKKVSFDFIHLKNSLAEVQAELESVIEFPEEDIPEIVEDKKTLYTKYRARVEEILSYFQEIYENYQAGRKLAEGFRFVIIGSPNSGKSTLFNHLLRESRALVSELKGTTRDYISERYSLSDHRENLAEVALYDTAGIHENPESIEAMGIEKLPELAMGADLVIWLVSGWSCYQEFIDSTAGSEILSSIRERHFDLSTHFWVFLNKTDLLKTGEEEKIREALARDFPGLNPPLQLRFSLLVDPEGSRNQIESLFRKWVKTTHPVNYQSLALLNQRQGDLVGRILSELHGIRDKIDRLESEEVVVEDFRRLNRDLKELSLETGPENVYDLLFSRFCIGK